MVADNSSLVRLLSRACFDARELLCISALSDPDCICTCGTAGRDLACILACSFL